MISLIYTIVVQDSTLWGNRYVTYCIFVNKNNYTAIILTLSYVCWWFGPSCMFWTLCGILIRPPVQWVPAVQSTGMYCRVVNRCFRGVCCLHHQGTFETSVDIRLTTRQYIPEDSELRGLILLYDNHFRVNVSFLRTQSYIYLKRFWKKHNLIKETART
jgi:hypothetical protein